MKITNGHVLVGVFVLFGLVGLAGTRFKINWQKPTLTPFATAKKIAEDEMNQFSEEFKKKLAEGKKPNRLAYEKSPYLLQHAFNPVDWHPWGEEAFEKARKENKPIFLSIGYSTCHWCHVMERESFENDSIAAIMNKHFVCIKVDREERPDVDKVYMSTVQAITGSGGWPLSAWLTPELKPFYGGTYFPPESKFGRPGFPDILLQLSNAWNERREEVLQSGNNLVEALKKHTTVAADSSVIQLAPLMQSAYSQYDQMYDARLGGFGSAPKFPRPVSFNFLLRYYARSNEQNALDMTLNTLKSMWAGGMYDHLGGGFHRYSVDEHWRVPHFEKMLYDQSQLVWSYLEAYQITNDSFYADAATDILNYILRDMTHPEGGFYSAEDADSAADPEQPEHKEEGAFYLWLKDEVVALLGEKDAEVFNYLYGVSETGNTINDPHNEFRNGNVLYAAHSVADVAKQFNHSEAEVYEILKRSKPVLFEVREKRPRPHLDDKVITAWNGLMISAFARAYQVLGEKKYLEAAARAAEFVMAKSFDADTKTLKRRFRDGEAKYPAHLDDYAFFSQGLIDLYEASFEIKWLKSAVVLTETMIPLFYDTQDAGFFDTSGEDKTIFLRMKEDYDGAEPTGNSIAVSNLLRLSQMLDRKKWWEFAEKTIRLFANRIQKAPHIMPQMLAAADFSLGKPKQIIIAGKPDSPDTQEMLGLVHQRYLPNKILLLADDSDGQKFLSENLSFIESVAMIDNKATAYVCENYVCQLPTNNLNTFVDLLEGKKSLNDKSED